ncbi:MAG: phage terminase large subunit family protein [Verrucomicrobiales bacterium]|nr:phage terminase large subunit family protein [Verrucomicrobiales bacterium]
MTQERQFLAEVLSDFYKPRCREPIGAWAARSVTLPKIEGAFAGLPYDLSRSPLMRDVFDFWQSDDPAGFELVIMKGSQGGYTLGSAVAVAYDFANDPGSVLYLSNKGDAAAATGKFRFVPIIRQADPQCSDDIDDAGEGAVKKLIKGCLFLCAGGQVPSDIISWPIRKAIVDEAALHKVTDKGSTIDLAEKRTEKQPGRKVLVFSKPERWPTYRADPKTGVLSRTSGDETIFSETYLRGTQEVPMVPCPHCAGFQELTDEQFRAPKSMLPGIDLPESEIDLEEIERNTWYECVHCQHPIYEQHKPGMVAAYRMEPAPLAEREARRRGFAKVRRVAVDPRYPEIVNFRRAEPGVRSVHVSDLYNVASEECTWGKLHRKKLAAQRNPEKFAIYCKDTRGLPPPEEAAVAVVTPKILTRLCGAYHRLQIIDPLTGMLQGPQQPLPCDPARLILTVDYQAGEISQASYFPWLLTAWDRLGSPWVVDWGAVRTEDALWDLLQMEFATPAGKKGKITHGLMDSGYDRTNVLEFCKRDGVYGRLWPAAGVSKLLDIDRHDLSRKIGYAFWVYNYRATYWEERLYRWQLGKWCEFLDPKVPGLLHSDSCKRHAAITPRPWLPLDVDDEFLAQISNMHETLADDEDPAKGLTWKKIHVSKPNDYGDACKLSLLAWRLFQPKQQQQAGALPPEAAAAAGQQGPSEQSEEDPDNVELRGMGFVAA